MQAPVTLALMLEDCQSKLWHKHSVSCADPRVIFVPTLFTLSQNLWDKVHYTHVLLSQQVGHDVTNPPVWCSEFLPALRCMQYLPRTWHGHEADAAAAFEATGRAALR
jgi:hypothetical protein